MRLGGLAAVVRRRRRRRPREYAPRTIVPVDERAGDEPATRLEAARARLKATIPPPDDE